MSRNLRQGRGCPCARTVGSPSRRFQGRLRRGAQENPVPDGRIRFTARRERYFAAYQAAVPEGFRHTADNGAPYRILAPGKGDQAAPANYCARYFHDVAFGGKAYGFAYDDAAGYAEYTSCSRPKTLIVAIGF